MREEYEVGEEEEEEAEEVEEQGRRRVVREESVNGVVNRVLDAVELCFLERRESCSSPCSPSDAWRAAEHEDVIAPGIDTWARAVVKVVKRVRRPWSVKPEEQRQRKTEANELEKVGDVSSRKRVAPNNINNSNVRAVPRRPQSARTTYSIQREEAGKLISRPSSVKATSLKKWKLISSAPDK